MDCEIERERKMLGRDHVIKADIEASIHFWLRGLQEILEKIDKNILEAGYHRGS